jgi:hypothetical protein
MFLGNVEEDGRRQDQKYCRQELLRAEPHTGHDRHHTSRRG